MTSGHERLAALEQASRRIQDPVAKLRFIRKSLERGPALEAVPAPRLQRWFSRRVSPEALRMQLRSNPLGARPSTGRVAAQRPPAFAWNRPVAAVAALGALAAVWATLSAARSLSAPSGPRGLMAATALPTLSEGLPAAPAAQAPSKVWLVEEGPSWEQDSNGLRIDTSFAVAGEPRRFRVFQAGVGLAQDTLRSPVGILFHTSESDIWPLEESFNESLRDSSQRLLRYVQRNRLYHYLIDRFGRVFRVVEETGRANHAGHSIWEADGRVILNLNSAFLGVSFESRWEGGRALPITQAQLAAGRSLTELLRQRYGIAPEMCVTHGLTSVNPRKHLIGHHLDWARGFPFDAFGLPDQYQRPAPSVARFGFDYDDDFLKVLEEPWPGVRGAEAALRREAERAHRDVEDVRYERQTTYDRWIERQQSGSGDDADRAATPAEAERVSGRTTERSDVSTSRRKDLE